MVVSKNDTSKEAKSIWTLKHELIIFEFMHECHWIRYQTNGLCKQLMLHLFTVLTFIFYHI